MNYLDTSALVKRFVTEKGSQRVHQIVSQEDPVATAKITYAEVYAALTRRMRASDLTTTDFARACRSFEKDWVAYVRVDLRDEVLLLARDVIRRYALRGFDGIHLASARILSDALDEPVTFVAADDRLLQAAAAEGLSVVNPEA